MTKSLEENDIRNAMVDGIRDVHTKLALSGTVLPIDIVTLVYNSGFIDGTLFIGKKVGERLDALESR